MPGKDVTSGTVYFEFRPLGQQMRVAAIDADTGTEVVFAAPLTATRAQMEAIGLAKLRRRLSGSDVPESRRF